MEMEDRSTRIKMLELWENCENNRIKMGSSEGMEGGLGLNKVQQIKVGCCGFAGAQKQYFELFNVIEIQQTFYQLPEIKTAEKWRMSAPPGFEFTMKAWQLITHVPSSPTYRRLREPIEPAKAGRYGSFRPTKEVFDAWKRTAAFARTLGATIIVFQCPASFRPLEQNMKNMETFFTGIDRTGFALAWEPRGAWPDDLVVRLCKELDLIHCVDPFRNEALFGDVDYLRLHGIGDYQYRYTDDELGKLKKKVGRKPAYVMFNNSTMKEDALRFIRGL
jgi:uncharacterized protein YecE (DUF72 family)